MGAKNRFDFKSQTHFVTRYVFFLAILSFVSLFALEFLPLPLLDRAGFMSGLGIFATSALLTLISSRILLRSGPGRSGSIIAVSKLILTGAALFVVLVVLELDGIAVVVGAMVAVVLSSISFFAAVKTSA